MGQGSKSPHYRRENRSICNLCDAHLTQEDILTHMTEKHCGSYFYQCHICRNYSGNKSSSLFQHQRDKHNASYYYICCPLCREFSSPKENSVITHLVNVHSRIENLCFCNYCNLYSKNNLDGHFKEVHSHYMCVFNDCQAVCLNSKDLFLHYMINHFPKLTLFYSCSECDILFPKENSVYQHERDKHGIYPDDSDDDDERETLIKFHCSMCSFTAWNKRNYEQHFINNHRSNFFNCTYLNCNYQTKLFWSLTQHTIDKHLSENFLRYGCDVCEEISYAQIHSLMQHLRDKHSVIDVCYLCNTYEDDLKDHILSDPDHSFEVYLCRICDEEYEEKDDLIDHISNNHFHITPLLKRLCYGD